MALACDFRVALFIRLTISLLLFIAVVLIAVANGSCVKITTANSPSRNSKTDRDYTDTRTECSHGSNYQFSIDSWSSLDGKIIGQAFVFAFTMILCLSTALQLVYFMCMGPRNEVVEKFSSYGSAVVCLICACIEVWYATGFHWTNKANPRVTVQLLSVTTWAVAAAFLFLVSFMFILDGLMAHMEKDDIEEEKSRAYRYTEEPKRSPVNHPFL